MASSPPIRPSFSLTNPPSESPTINQILNTLKLVPHPEGGYYIVLDRDPRLVPNPFLGDAAADPGTGSQNETYAASPQNAHQAWTHNASSSIHYLLTPKRSLGAFHRNKARIIHTIHWGRAQYVVLHPATDTKPSWIETFVVGTDIAAGERLHWIVEGGTFKASFLLEDGEVQGSERGCLISEAVVPGWEESERDFLSLEMLGEWVGEEANELEWLLKT